MTIVIGISAYYHDSAAAILQDGNLIAAAQEERFTRIKHDPAFPTNAVNFCLKAANTDLSNVNYITFYDKPLVKFERLLETYLSYAPSGLKSFIKSMPIWLKEKLFLKSILKKEINKISNGSFNGKILFTEHHQAHASSAYFASPYTDAAVLCLDGVGEWATTTLWEGKANHLKSLWEINFPHSLGLLYSAFTYYIGFKVNSGEYKLMGLAPYGEEIYVDKILDHLIDIKEDGSFILNMEYFNYTTGLTMVSKKFEDLFGVPARKPESQVTQKEMDIAKSIQVVTEKIILKICQNIKNTTGHKNLCLAGGVALNCVANGKLLRENIFDNIWIQPASGDAGGAIGACFSTWYEYLDKPRDNGTSLFNPFLGPSFSNDEIESLLKDKGVSYEKHADDILIQKASEIISNENVIGWFQGKMEFGPRALGGRSIIGDPRSSKMQSIMNLKIKYRESFRPFAPAVKMDAVSSWFDIKSPSPYMLLVADIQNDKKIKMTEQEKKLFGIDKLKIKRSEIPAVTHVDYSARVQTIHEELTPRFYQLSELLEQHTGCPVLINTSFNVRGEPIVCSPEDALRCFTHTEMDVLIMENIIIYKDQQTSDLKNIFKKLDFELD